MVFMERFFRAIVVYEIFENVPGELIHARVDGVGLINDLPFENIL